MSFGSFVFRAVKRNLTFTKNRAMALVNSLSFGETSVCNASKSQRRSLLLTNITAISGLGAFAAGCITTAYAGDVKDPNKPRGQTFVHNVTKKTWASSRLQSDICHMAPSISEVLLDILDVLQENCDSYVSSMKKRVNELESNLQKYGSTMSLNLSDDEAESVSLSDPGSSEIQRFRREYRSAYKQCNDMVTGLDRFLSSAQHFGTKTCIEKCEQEMVEIRRLLENIELQIVHYERKLAMAEKHFHSKRRRVAVGQNKTYNDIKEHRG